MSDDEAFEETPPKSGRSSDSGLRFMCSRRLAAARGLAGEPLVTAAHNNDGDMSDDDAEFNRELMRLIWRADPWNRYSKTVDMLRLISLFVRLAVAVIQAIAG